jgi:tRNA modification GTPase
LNEDRAIVSSIPGTTRDAVEDTLTIDGIQFRFIDTAGLRETDDQIELIGVAKAKDKVNKAKILIYLFDQNDISIKEVCDSIESFQREDLIIITVENKIDLRSESQSSNFNDKLKSKLKNKLISAFIRISTFDSVTVDKLKTLLIDQVKNTSTTEGVVVSNARHLNSLQNSLKAILSIKKGLKSNLSGDLLTVDINEALNHLGEISGEITNDELLGNIFSKFCIGK